MNDIPSAELAVLAPEGAPPVVRGDEDYVARVPAALRAGARTATGFGVTDRFREVIDYFGVPEGQTPPGFRIDPVLEADGSVRFDLARDLAYDSNGRLRPTPLLFSVDTANPYEVAPCAHIVANLTCNPGIVYDLFINDPKANVDNKFQTLEEVMTELGRILGPGCDMSVELNNPFEPDFGKLLEQVQSYEEILSKHRLVVKVPHTGPVNAENVHQLLDGDKMLDVRYDDAPTGDYMRGHNLALKLHEHGYRVNFTLMFDAHQTPLALQARPYFINAFLRHRLAATRRMAGLVAGYEATDDRWFVEQLRSYLVKQDYLTKDEADRDLFDVLEIARTYLRNRRWDGEGADGLDHARQALRWLKTSNLPDTRLILCSMEGDTMFPDIMSMLTEDEFLDMHHRALITTEPGYLARWTSAPQVVSYQRRFMTAARAVNEAPVPSQLASELQETAP